MYPGPRTHDGLLFEDQDNGESEKTLKLVNRMIADLTALNISGDDLPPPEYLARTWHEDMIWYGPAGIGATYTIPRYQEQHQYPFRTDCKESASMATCVGWLKETMRAFFGWPNLTNTAVGGFLWASSE